MQGQRRFKRLGRCFERPMAYFASLVPLETHYHCHPILFSKNDQKTAPTEGQCSRRRRAGRAHALACQRGLGLRHVPLNVHHQELQLVGEAQQNERK